MAFIIKDRVKEATTSTGTGAVSLGGAAATFDTFQSYMTNGDTTYYAIVHTTSGTDEWEVGLGTWNTGNTLTRTTVLAGSNGTSAVNFSAGTKDVFMTYPAAHAALAGDDVTFANITVTGTVDGRDVAADGTKLDTVETNADVTDAVNVAAAGALMKSGGTMTGNLILNADPTTALGAATKEYVDTIAAAGIHYHTPVRVETPSALNATYDNGSSGVGATLTNAGTQAALVIDGVTVATNDRVLVYNQTNAAHNGIYTVTNTGSASTNWVLTRATDADSYGASDPNAMGEGDAYFVKEGDTGAGELYVMNTSGTITFGTTEITFTVIAETAVYSAGTGMSLNGTTFSIGQDVGTTANVTFNQVTAAIIGNVTGNLTGDVTGNADTATALETARTIQLSGDVTGSATFDGTANVTITAAVQDDSHAHVISNVDGLQAALDGKTTTSRTITAGNGLTGGGDLSANRTLNVGAGSGISVTADAVAHADTSTQASVNNSGNTFIQDVTLDGFGHVTGLTSGSVSVGDAVITIAAGGGLQTGGDFTTNQSINETITLAHADTSSVSSSNNSGNTFIQDLTFDTYGHVTAVGTGTVSVGNAVINVSAGGGLTGGGDFTTNQSDNETLTLSHADTSSQASVNNSGGNVIQDITLDGYGHITGLASVNLDGRYYTETEADSRFVNVTGDTATGKITFTGGARIHPSSGGDTSRYLELTSSNELEFYNSDGTIGTLYLQYSGSNDELRGPAGGIIFHDNYHPNADKWTTARTLSLSGDASGSVSWDGSANATLNVTAAGDINMYRGDITTHDWNTFIDGTETSYHSVVNATGSNRPPAYQYGLAVSWSRSGQGKFQMYAPHNGSDGGNGLWFRSGWNTDYDAWSEIWHSRNDGSGSGLDADLLDGVQGSSFARKDSGVPDFQYGIQAGDIYVGTDGDTDGDYNQTIKATGNNILYLNHGGSGIVDSANAVHAPIFYDRNNTTYYLDPAGTSRANTLWVSTGGTGGRVNIGGDTSGAHMNINYDQIWTGTGHLYLQYSSSGNIIMNVGGGYASSSTSFRAPIFYDSNNTGYYVNPASTSVLNNLTVNGTVTGISASAKNDIFWENGQNVTSNYTITNGKNAMSAGPITVNSGVTVTVGSGETWTVV